MVKLIAHFFVLLAFVTFNDAYGLRYSEDDVTPDFKKMLGGPNSPKEANESFATHVTRPFIAGTEKDLSFFSNPEKSKWDRKRKDWKSDGYNLKALDIFETMGISSRGILNNGDSKYESISKAQAEGMLSIVSGSLGFANRICTGAEEAIMARELLTTGRSMKSDGALMAELSKLENAYRTVSSIDQKHHLQISALYLLVGHGSSVKAGWYTNGIKYEGALQAKIKYFASQFLPAASTAPAAQVEPKDVVIKRLTYERKPQMIFGTDGVKVSGLHATFLGEGRYPNIMVLGSHKVPMKAPKDMLSITAELSPGRYFVVMQPEVFDDIVLRPQYMEVEANDPTSGMGRGQTEITFFQGNKKEGLTIDWVVEGPKVGKGEISTVKNIAALEEFSGSSVSKIKPTEKRLNDGQVKPQILKNEWEEETYSFIAHVNHKAQKKHFYYWCPTVSQMRLLQEFIKEKESFKFGDLYEYIKQLRDEPVAPSILDEITKITQSTLKNFNN